MVSFQLLMIVNDAPNIGSRYRYYVDGKRVTRQYYDTLCCNSMRQDSFITKVEGHMMRHYKTVYIA